MARLTQAGTSILDVNWTLGVHHVREWERIATSRTSTAVEADWGSESEPRLKFHRHRPPVHKAMTRTIPAGGGHATDARFGKLFSFG